MCIGIMHFLGAAVALCLTCTIAAADATVTVHVSPWVSSATRSINSSIASVAEAQFYEMFAGESPEQFLVRRCGYKDDNLLKSLRTLNAESILQGDATRTVRAYPCVFRSDRHVVTVPPSTSALGLAKRLIGTDGTETLRRIVSLNPDVDIEHLKVGQALTIPFSARPVTFSVPSNDEASIITSVISELSSTVGVTVDVGSSASLVAAAKPELSETDRAACSAAGERWPMDTAAVLDTLRRYTDGTATDSRAVDPQPAVAAIVDTGIRVADIPTLPLAAKRGEALAPPIIDGDRDGHVNDVYGLNVVANGGFPESDSNYDYSSHGLMVSSIASGVALLPDQTLLRRLVSLKEIAIVSKRLPPGAGTFTWDIYSSTLSASLVYIRGLVDHTPIIVNWSWESDHDDPTIKQMVRDARELIVVAAGNSPRDLDVQTVYPASLASEPGAVVISVAALRPDGQLATFSGRGKNVTLAAPGCSVPAFVGDQGISAVAGTSMSAPLVTFTAALVKALNVNASPSMLYNRIVASADKLPSLERFVGDGRVLNVGAAITVYDDIVRLRTGATFVGELVDTVDVISSTGVPIDSRRAYRYDIGGTADEGRQVNVLLAPPNSLVKPVSGILRNSTIRFKPISGEEETFIAEEILTVIPAMVRPVPAK